MKDSFCYFCGQETDRADLVEDSLAAGFNATRIVAAPDSDYICASCKWFLQEKATINLANQEVREAQKVRSYSWVVTDRSRVAYTKAHLRELQAICLEPPEAPFQILLSDTGKKHLFFRSGKNLSRAVITVQLEEAAITYQPTSLRAVLELCRSIERVAGKTALTKEPGLFLAAKLLDAPDGENLFEAWRALYPQPVAKLAAWLTYSDKESEYATLS